MKILFIYLHFFCAWQLCHAQKNIQWVCTTAEAVWETQKTDNMQATEDRPVDVEVDLLNPQQTIDGFGSCFNEMGWTSLSYLSETDRQVVLKELFEPRTGANFTICRMPVGANDFSLNWYSYNETDRDFKMKKFSIDNDRETLIPFIKSALRYNPDLKIWASPWSPPVWMKENRHYACQFGENDIKPEQVRREGVNMFIQEDAYFKAYALYFTKFIKAYRAEKIAVFMVMPQNEFNSCQPFPSCTWLPSALNKFVGKYLGPEMKKLGVELMFGTMERPHPAMVDTLLQDTESGKYITGAGFQWDGKHAVATIHKNYPALKLYQTEQECGNGVNDWGFAMYAWGLMKDYVNNGVNVYEYWNTSLEEGGTSRWGWRQNSLVTVNAKDKTYQFTYDYYVMKHASHFVLPGAKKLPATGNFTDLLAFRNPEGSFVIILRNGEDKIAKPVIRMGKYTFAPQLKPNSLNTILIK
ncbi:MAG: beta-glycosidase [Tannerella sp.]|jgi:glucosylceramidase|nr:beta-glycosidase [Tannerella sp.]